MTGWVPAIPIVTLALLATVVGLSENDASAEQVNRAGLVVAFPEDRTEVIWIEFAEEEISGAELLERSGLDTTISSYGGLGNAVCAIDGLGCDNPGDCFCQCKSGSCTFWVYFKLEDEEWIRLGVGPSTRMLRDGDVDGWAWGSGDPPPGVMDDNEACPTPAAPPPTPTPTPTPIQRLPDSAQMGPEASTSAPPSASDSTESPAGVEPSPGPADDEPPASAGSSSGSPTAEASPPGEVLGRLDPPSDGVASAGDPAEDLASEESGGGVPIGPIIFAAVAGAMIAGAAGIALRGRNAG